MSVINKMLRDLDRRQADPSVTQGATQVPGQRPRLKGTQSLGADLPQRVALTRGRAARRWGTALLVLLLLLAGAYVGWSGSKLERQSAPADSNVDAAATMAPPVASASASVAAPERSVEPSQASAPVALEPVGLIVKTPSTPKPDRFAEKKQPPKSAVASVAAAQPQNAPASAPVVLPSQLQTSASARLPAQSSVPPTPLPGAGLKTQTQVAMEALAQAQTQWAEGDQVGALQVVQGVIARLEKSPTGDTVALATAAREYVRMTTTQQRPADALAMLVRLELPLAQVADIWALRGNTAQRLGLHAQAAHAYLNALELQPGQARWLLGASVSLAAQGQTIPAAELAEQARRAGFLPTDVANYLQQLGVALHKP